MGGIDLSLEGQTMLANMLKFNFWKPLWLFAVKSLNEKVPLVIYAHGLATFQSSSYNALGPDSFWEFSARRNHCVLKLNGNMWRKFILKAFSKSFRGRLISPGE